MNPIQLKHGPFAIECPPHWGLPYMVTCDAESRLDLVKESTSADWLKAVIKSRGTQKTVRLAAERRLRWLNVRMSEGADK